MPCSPAQLAANQRNSRRSSGPRTAEGKAISRRNGLKHGLTGAGIVLPNEDVEEVERRFETLEAEMRPKSEMARQLVGRVALLTVRLDRSAHQESKALAHRMRQAAAEFDQDRLAEVDRLMAWIAAEPVTNVRRLRRMPEGVDRLIAAIQGLRDDLARVGGYRWGYEYNEQLHHLLGKRSAELPVTRARALTDAIAGNFRYLDATDGAGLETDARRVWAIGELVYLIDAEIAGLKKLRDEMDLEGLELDRAEAAARAMFDPSKDAILARKYEAATERGLYRAIREFRETQPTTEVIAEIPVAEELGSSSPEPPPGEDGPTFVDAIEAEEGGEESAGSPDDHQIGLRDGLEFTSGALQGPDRGPGRAVRGG